MTPPTGYSPTPVQTADPDNDDNNDSNIDTGRSTLADGYYESGVVTLDSGLEPAAPGADDGDDDIDSNLSVDFGFVMFDLALRKTVVSLSDTPLVPNASTVTFNIEVINQGNIAASNIVVNDYVDPAMFSGFDLALNPAGTTAGDAALGYNWATNADGAEATLAGTLNAGQSVSFPVTLRVAAGTLGQQLANYAEIATADDVFGNVTAPDVDSQPENAENDSDAVTVGDPLVDNEVNDNGDTDEDDHDVAYVSVDRFDLALIKTVSSFSDTPLVPGSSTVRFTMEIFNQGDTTATESITVVDYVQSGFTFDAGDNPGWDGTDPTKPFIVLDTDIQPGQSTTVDIVLRLDAGTDGDTLYNFAEIAGDGMPGRC